MLRVGPRVFGADDFAVMAIVNRTPDSFFDGGANVELSAALEAVARAVGDGADIVDIGGVRAGYGPAVDLPPADRLEGTLAATAISAWHGARVFRAHDVRATRRVLDMVASIRGTRAPAVARRGLA